MRVVFKEHTMHVAHAFPFPVYISGRPFVLRDSSEPRKTLPLSDRAENLEGIENRLKNDILIEAAKYEASIILTIPLTYKIHSGMAVFC